LVCTAAQGRSFYNDDTTMKVLELTREQRSAALADDANEERTACSPRESSPPGRRKIALFFTGVRHAGETSKRSQASGSRVAHPIQMCDGSRATLPGL